MTAAARTEHAARPSALEVFIAHAEARAILWAACEFDLHEAVDALQAAAVASDLVAQLGQDEVQRLMAEAFAAVRDDVVPAELIEATPAVRGAAASTLMAAEYLVQQNDAERLHTWLAKHSASERIAIRGHLRSKGGR
jgi:hypothetical protein